MIYITLRRRLAALLRITRVLNARFTTILKNVIKKSLYTF